MNTRLVTLAVILFIGLAIAAPTASIAGNLPETPITKILNYQTGLNLTETQTKQLTLINNNIINQMLQINAQAYNHKSEIDQAAKDWAATWTQRGLLVLITIALGVFFYIIYHCQKKKT